MLTLKLLGTQFSIESDEGWRRFLEQLWAPFVTELDGEPARARITRRGSDSRLEFAQGWAVEDDDPWSIVDELRNATISVALEAAPRHVVALHAAVVERDGSVVLLAGPTGAGKTTLALELVERGWRYHGDDFAPVLTDSGAVLSFPKPPHVKSPSAWERYRPRWTPPQWVRRPQQSFLLPAPVLGPVGRGEVRPSHLLFPRYLPDEESKTRVLASADAAARAASNLHCSRERNRTGLAAVARLCRDVHAAEINYGSVIDGIGLIQDWLASADACVYDVANG